MSLKNLVGDATIRAALLTKYNKRDFVFDLVISHNGKHYTRVRDHDQFTYHLNTNPSAIEICEDVLGMELNTAFADIILKTVANTDPVDDASIPMDYALYDTVVQETRLWVTIQTHTGYIVALSPNRELTVALSNKTELAVVGANGSRYVTTKHSLWRMWQRIGVNFNTELMSKIANGSLEPLGGSKTSFNVDFEHGGNVYHARVKLKGGVYHVITIVKNRLQNHPKIRKAQVQRDKAPRGKKMKWVKPSISGKRRMEPVKKGGKPRYEDYDDYYDRFA